jgi:hypothetical protein
MTVNAESHLEAVTLESVLGLHRAMALLTGEVFPYVSLVIEQYVLRNVVHFFPRGGGLVVVVPVLFLYPGMLGNDVLVAVQTLFHRWQSRVVGIAHIGVAVKALDLFHPNVQLVAERYGLFRANVRRITVEEIEKEDYSKG